MKKRTFPVKIEKLTSGSRRGNVLFLILFTAAVITGAVYLFTQEDDHKRPPNREVKSITSRSITQYADAIAKGVAKMEAKGLSIDDIEFYAPTHPHFNDVLEEEAGKPLVFHPTGGGVRYSPVESDTVETVVKESSRTQNQNWHFVQLIMPGIGTKKKDLVAVLEDIKESLCERIDQRVTGKEVIPVINMSFQDVLNEEAEIKSGELKGKTSFCMKTTDRFLYYRVLSAQ